jgi:hypothetical protein
LKHTLKFGHITKLQQNYVVQNTNINMPRVRKAREILLNQGLSQWEELQWQDLKLDFQLKANAYSLSDKVVKPKKKFLHLSLQTNYKCYKNHGHEKYLGYR